MLFSFGFVCFVVGVVVLVLVLGGVRGQWSVVLLVDPPPRAAPPVRCCQRAPCVAVTCSPCDALEQKPFCPCNE